MDYIICYYYQLKMVEKGQIGWKLSLVSFCNLEKRTWTTTQSNSEMVGKHCIEGDRRRLEFGLGLGLELGLGLG